MILGNNPRKNQSSCMERKKNRYREMEAGRENTTHWEGEVQVQEKKRETTKTGEEETSRGKELEKEGAGK
jgi:hypothetical protein